MRTVDPTALLCAGYADEWYDDLQAPDDIAQMRAELNITEDRHITVGAYVLWRHDKETNR